MTRPDPTPAAPLPLVEEAARIIAPNIWSAAQESGYWAVMREHQRKQALEKARAVVALVFEKLAVVTPTMIENAFVAVEPSPFMSDEANEEEVTEIWTAMLAAARRREGV